MMANGDVIEHFHVRQGPVAIAYNTSFELHEARKAAGVTLAEFNRMPGIPAWVGERDTMSKAHLLVWYRYHKRIEAVQAEANIRQIETERRRRGGRGR